MNTKNMVMMMTSLIVGVLLITGIVIPVISNAIGGGSGSGSGEGMRYAYNPTSIRYVDVIGMYEDGAISDDGLSISDVESYLGAWSGWDSPMTSLIVQWEGDDSPTYLTAGMYYATDGTNIAWNIYLTDVDLENKTCNYNIDTTFDGDPSPTSKTFTSLKVGLDGTDDRWEPYYSQSNEGQFYSDVELADLNGITTIGIAATGGSDEQYSTLAAYAINDTLYIPADGTVTRTMTYADHILSSVTYSYTSGGSNSDMDDVMIIAPLSVQYETDDGKISGNNVSLGRFVDGRAYMNAMYGSDDGNLPLAGGQNGLIDIDTTQSAITAIITTDDDSYGPVSYAWQYILPYSDTPCVGSGETIVVAGNSPVSLYMSDIDWSAQTCTLYLRPDIGYPDFHFDSVKVLMKDTDIGFAMDKSSATEIYNSATLGMYSVDSQIRLTSLDDATVIGQESTEDKTSGLVWVVNDENKNTDVTGNLTYTPTYSDHVLSGVAYTFSTGGSTLDIVPIGIIAPISYEYNSESGGSGGLSPTLTAIMSVIPLLMVVALVIMAIGFVKRN